MSKFDERLDEILSRYRDYINGWQEDKPNLTKDEAKQAIRTLVLEEVIGYEPYPDDARDVTYDLMIRSGLRAEQRKKVLG